MNKIKISYELHALDEQYRPKVEALIRALMDWVQISENEWLVLSNRLNAAALQTEIEKKLKSKYSNVVLKDAYDKGIVISGMSAGAICWFDWYDNEEYIDGDNSKLDILPGLGYIPGFCVPHWNTKTEEEKQIMRNMLKVKGVQGIALDNGTALVYENGEPRIIKSIPNATVEYL